MIDEPGFGRLDLQGEVARVDPALREAPRDEPEAGLRGAHEHVAQLLPFAEAPDRADARGDLVAEELRYEVLLSFPACGEHDEVGILEQSLELVYLREADLAFGDEVGAADVEVVAAAGREVHELPAGVVLAEVETKSPFLEPIEQRLVQVLRVLGGGPMASSRYP